MRLALRIPLTVAALAATAFCIKLTRFRPPSQKIEATSAVQQLQIAGSAMGTQWSIRFARPLDDSKAQEITLGAQTILDRIDREMSTWKPDSDLTRFNLYRGEDWFPVPQELAEIVSLSLQIGEETAGAFDITVGPLVNLWGFGPRTTVPKNWLPPSADSITAAKCHVGYQKLNVRLSPPALRKLDAVLYVDLSAIAQGYACDRVADYLDSIGIADYLVDVSSEIRTKGVSSSGRPWRIGIQEPTADTLRVIRGVSLSNAAFSPSGDYQNYFEHAGIRYCHEIDPRTGSPIQNRLASAAVSHPSAAYADAMATALMVLGPEAGYELAKKQNLAACFILRTGNGFETHATPAFEQILVGQSTTKSSEE